MKHAFERYCKNYQDIENYEKAKKDNFVGWECHHRLETHTPGGEIRTVIITAAELKALDMYYNRPASELIFLIKSEHNRLRRYTEESRRKMSELKKGEKNPNYGKPSWNKGKKMSEEARKKMGEAKKGKNNPNYGKHFSEEHKKKLREAHKGKNIWTKGVRWYNNGEKCIRAKECPPGFVPGRLRK